MERIKITVATVGHMPAEFDKRKITNWKSDLFYFPDEIESYALTENSDGHGWEFTDSKLEHVLPDNFRGDFLIAIVNVPIELNYYSRRLSGNRIIFTFHEIKEILDLSNIPIENIIYRLLYAYTLLFLRAGRKIPSYEKCKTFTHDETRGCLFDMNGVKWDVVHSCNQPVVCRSCEERLRQEKISDEIISKTQREISKVRKPLFYRIMTFIKKHPIAALFISAISAILLGAIGSFISTLFYEYIKTLV